MAEKHTIAVFDFDGTITRRDSFIDFLIFTFGYIKLIKSIFPLLPGLLLYLLGIASSHIAKERIFSYFFKGFTESEFNRLCKNYSLHRLDSIIDPQVLEKIRFHQEKKHTLVIASASIKNWIQPWAEKNMFDEVIATEIEIQDNILTGKFKTKNCTKEEKAKRFLERHSNRKEYFLYVYGNSKGDEALLSLADIESFRHSIKNEDMVSKFLLLIIFAFSIFWAISLINTFWGDPTIYLSYAKNIAKGDFFSFNTKQFSSGSTSPLWAVILSLGFLLPNSINIAKIISLVFVLLALFITYKMAFKISKSRIGSVLGTSLLLYFLAIPGLMMFESSLIVCLVSILLLLNFRITKQNEKISKKDLLGILLVWSLIPLVRPDAAIIVFVNLLVLICIFLKNKKLVSSFLSIFALSFIPSLLYFGYSYLASGAFSVSSYCRAFALKEGANSFLGLHYSLSTIKLFLSFPLIYMICFAFWGLGKYRKIDKVHKLMAYFAVVVLAGYLFMLSIISPVSADAGRYILPIFPFLVLFASFGFADLWGTAVKRKYISLLLCLVLFFVCIPLYRVTRGVANERKRGLDFDTITEKQIIKYFNDFAEPDETILVYEVQDRYYLRHDLNLLSLDGITDGKIAPYLANGDISSFLQKYKPRYWLANDAVFDRPFLSKSILRKVVEKSGQTEGSSVLIDGMIFTNIQIREEPVIEGFSAYKQLYKIDYNPQPYAKIIF